MLALSLTRDKTGVYFLSVFQADGVTPQSLVGLTLWFHASYPPAAFQINKSSPSNGITIQNTAGGADCATLQIEPTDSAALGIDADAIAAMNCELSLVMVRRFTNWIVVRLLLQETSGHLKGRNMHLVLLIFAMIAKLNVLWGN